MKLIILTVIYVNLISVSLPFLTFAGNVAFVENGKSKGIIVVTSTNENVISAANEMQKMMKASSGVEVPILNNPQEGKNILRITTYEESGEERTIVKDGFKVHSPSSTEIVIQGGDDIGAANGVYHFLEKNLGVRWLKPGNKWTYVPKKQNIIFPDKNYIEEPTFFSRSWFSGGDIYTNPDQQYISWRKKMGIMNSNKARVKFHHSLDKMFKPAIYCNKARNPGQYHPEWYPTINGVAQCSNKHIPSTNGFEWEPVLDNQSLIKEAIRTVNEFFNDNPNENWYSLGMSDNDKWGDGALDNYENATDYYITFVNKVAAGVVETHPNARFGFLAYKNIKQPPVNVSLHPAVLPVLTYERTRWALSEGEATDKELTNGWLDKVSEIGWYDYSYGDVYKIPRIYFNNLSRAFKFAKKTGVTMITSEAYPYTPHWVGGPKAYVYAKLNWDTSIDTQKMLDEWNELAVGEMAKNDLGDYYNFWQDYWEKKIPNSEWFKRYFSKNDYLYYKSDDYLSKLTLDDLTYLENKIIETVKKADSPIHRERAEFICNSWNRIKLDIYDKVYSTGDGSGPGDNLNCSTIQQAGCSTKYLGFCTNQSACNKNNGHWCNNQCQDNKCGSPSLSVLLD